MVKTFKETLDTEVKQYFFVVQAHTVAFWIKTEQNWFEKQLQTKSEFINAS
jgi:hypothetical protein